ncbi:hypothetical protein [Micromonospora globbae]|uniref:Uncharacterized protein n=1 Tax=Micromonospora globbae TaxID=1894969 RepID=A0A420EYB3_9ACTN|nr:hypothetical protein [Micromonospora globbae]RKF25237.1 hypothetical protein D7I43_22550 [Micromonospora globbae]
MTDDLGPRRPPTYDLTDADCHALERALRIAVCRPTDFADDLAEHLDEVARRRRRRAAELRAYLLDPTTHPTAETVDYL